MAIGRTISLSLAGATLALGAPTLFGATNLAQESPLIWVITGIAVGGAVITFAFLVYGVLKFRDPTTRRRRYG